MAVIFSPYIVLVLLGLPANLENKHACHKLHAAGLTEVLRLTRICGARSASPSYEVPGHPLIYLPMGHAL